MRRLVGILLAAILALAVAGPLAAQAGPPQRTQAPIWGIASDFSTYVLFINITAVDFCAWFDEGDFDTEPEVVSLVTVQQKETGKGAIVETFRATVYAELWAVDGGDPEAICAGAGERLGTGTVFTASTDNDLFLSGTRSNAFGGMFHGTLQGVAGSWRVSGEFRLLITQDFEFRLLHEAMRVRAVR